MDETAVPSSELAQLARLALAGSEADVRMYVSRLSRRYRKSNQVLAKTLADYLVEPRAQRSGPEASTYEPPQGGQDETRLSVLRLSGGTSKPVSPVFPESLKKKIEQLLLERSRGEELLKHGLRPVSSAVFVGPPGVGKTATAHWLAGQLGMPLFTLDLTAVMSSRLGQSGANLRSALDQSRATPSVLFLDEIDAIAKRRDDTGDVGELKRLVTILLQELDDWPASSLVLAATNHAELVDPALWRRFDQQLEFENPEIEQIEAAIRLYSGGDVDILGYAPALSSVLKGCSYADIKKQIVSLRKSRLLGYGTTADLVGDAFGRRMERLTRSERLVMANQLVESGSLSQRRVAELTGVSRDTLRKRATRRADEQGE